MVLYFKSFIFICIRRKNFGSEPFSNEDLVKLEDMNEIKSEDGDYDNELTSKTLIIENLNEDVMYFNKCLIIIEE